MNVKLFEYLLIRVRYLYKGKEITIIITNINNLDILLKSKFLLEY